MSAERIAQKLSIMTRETITPYAVKGQVQGMGIAQPKSPRWTTKELELLSQLIHQYSIRQIARRLHRSTNAVKIKATRLKLGLRMRDGWFTKRETCEILGVDHKKMQKYIDGGLLKATWHNGRKPQKNGNKLMGYLKIG